MGFKRLARDHQFASGDLRIDVGKVSRQSWYGRCENADCDAACARGEVAIPHHPGNLPLQTKERIRCIYLPASNS
jgi:hypothetical protein